MRSILRSTCRLRIRAVAVVSGHMYCEELVDASLTILTVIVSAKDYAVILHAAPCHQNLDKVPSSIHME